MQRPRHVPRMGEAVSGWPAYSRDLCRTRRVITCRTSCSGCSRLSTPSMPRRDRSCSPSPATARPGRRRSRAAWSRRSGPIAARRSASMTTTSTTGPNAASCRSPRCTPTATTYRSWSSTCSCSPGASRSSSRSTTTTPGSSPARCWSSRVSSSSLRGSCRCTPSSPASASTRPSSWTHRKRSGGPGRSAGTPRNAATRQRRCWPNWNAARPSPRRSYSRSAGSRTSSSGSRLSRAASCRRARRCPPS